MLVQMSQVRSVMASAQKGVRSNSKATPGLLLPVQVFKSISERDPELINQDLKVKFVDVIAEPTDYYTPKFSWNLSQEVYEFGKGCCYSIISFLFGIPAAFLWGIWFAILACVNVWCLVPLRRCSNILMSCWKAFWSVFVSTFFDPVYQSMGMVFSNMTITTENYIV